MTGLILPMMRKRAPVSAFGESDLIALYDSGTYDGSFYDLTNTSNLWQDTGRTSAVTTNGQTVQGVTDLSGNANHLSNASGIGTWTTGTPNHTLFTNGGTWPSNLPGTTTFDYFIGVETSDTDFVLFGTDSTGIFADRGTSGGGANAWAGIAEPDYFINTDPELTSPVTRGNWNTAVATGSFLTAIIENAEFVGSLRTIRVGQLGSSQVPLDGKVVCVVIIESAAIGAADRTNIIEYIQGLYS